MLGTSLQTLAVNISSTRQNNRLWGSILKIPVADWKELPHSILVDFLIGLRNNVATYQQVSSATKLRTKHAMRMMWISMMLVGSLQWWVAIMDDNDLATNGHL
jgi:hypothetical protein